MNPVLDAAAPAAVMGVLNVTPDSFSDGGAHLDPDAARRRVVEMIDEGVEVIDVGGESTRPGALAVDEVVEQARVLPVLEAIADLCEAAGVRRSIDTRNPGTARAAVAAGASLLNDVSAELFEVAAELGVGWVAMHMAGDPRTMQVDPTYDDVVDDVRSFLVQRAAAAVASGVEEVWLDPGIGFGKTTAHNVALLAHLDRLVAEGFPVLVGTSRKRSVGVLLARSDAGEVPHPGPPGGRAYFGGPDPVELADRLDGSLVTATWAMIQGARMIRAHDVGPTVRAAALVAGRVPAATGWSNGATSAPRPADQED
jgi:dihydropteroate synthase